MSEDLHDDRVPPADDESLREYGRQLAMDSILRLALGAAESHPATAARASRPQDVKRRRPRPKWWMPASIAALAVCLLLAIGLTWWWRSPKDRPIVQLPPPPPEAPERPAVEPPPPAPINRAGPPRNVARSPVIALPSGWIAEPTGEVDCQMLAADRLRLQRGELRVYRPASADRGDDPPPVTVETPNGTAVARGTEFFVGSHVVKSVTQNLTKGDHSMFRMTRVLVLAGVVSLSNAAGTIDGGAGSLLAAEPGKAPANIAVEANSRFALDAYRQLAVENKEKNLFFSPYSMSCALAMAAEGARGQTADEMGKVLGFPEEARRVGDDAQLIPWNIAVIHSGIARLNEQLEPEKPELKDVREKIAILRKQLDEANKQAAAEHDYLKHEKLAMQGNKLANELNSLLAKVDQYEIRVANALWGEKTYPFRKEYIDTIHKYYQTGGIFPVDFRNNAEAARVTINNWVEKQTNDRIQNLIAEGLLGSDTRLVLTNAIYFKGEWATKFEPQQTRDADFFLANGGKKSVPMMNDAANASSSYAAFNADGSFFETPKKYNPNKNDVPLYPDDGGFTMLELPYKGGDLSFVAILPRTANGLQKLEQMMTDGGLQGWIEKLQARTVNVVLPKYRLEEGYSMSRTLRAMGMVRPFLNPGSSPDGAQFGGMCDDDDPNNQLYIGDVIHKAFVDVSEKGTEAAAATAVIMRAGGPMPNQDLKPFIPKFQADKPFIFLIRDKKSGSILFLGRMVKP